VGVGRRREPRARSAPPRTGGGVPLDDGYEIHPATPSLRGATEVPDQFPQVQAPQPQPPLAAVWAGSVVALGAEANENRRRTRSLPQFGQASSAWTVEPIGRRSSNGRSQLTQMYS
jgi:hypothetical protein